MPAQNRGQAYTARVWWENGTEAVWIWIGLGYHETALSFERKVLFFYILLFDFSVPPLPGFIRIKDQLVLFTSNLQSQPCDESANL